METSERRTALLRLLCRRRYDTINNLAQEFGVSERTIRRDIESLSLTEPIYTKTGRYGGGVFVVENYYFDRMYFTDSESVIMKKLLYYVETKLQDDLSAEEIKMIGRIIENYIKPLPGKRRDTK